MKYLFHTVSLCVAMLYTSVAFAGNVVHINVGVHESQTVELPRAMGQVIIEDRSVATVVKQAARKVAVTGQQVGRTGIRIMDGQRIITQINVNVTPSVTGVKKSLYGLFPNETIGVESANQSIVLTGTVSDAETAANVVAVVQEYAREAQGSSRIINLMKLRSGQQVMLKVRVGEVRRDALNRFGLGIHGILSGAALLGALEQEHAFRTLAEPTLTAISGQSAEFLAGGEFPVPVTQPGNTMSVEYKPFGVSVAFTPLVMSQNRIRLSVASEVSELSTEGAVTLQNMRIPAVTTRRANTTVELAPGESFVIAGLLRNDSLSSLYQVPGLGDIPILNLLFRSAEFKRNETELVIAVTPYVVNPARDADIVMPIDNTSQIRSVADMMFTGLFGKNTQKQDGGAEGGFGYILE